MYRIAFGDVVKTIFYQNPKDKVSIANLNQTWARINGVVFELTKHAYSVMRYVDVSGWLMHSCATALGRSESSKSTVRMGQVQHALMYDKHACMDR